MDKLGIQLLICPQRYYEEMAKAVYFAHMHRVRIYITVNTLVDDSEMQDLANYLLFLNNVGVDGIIVQDLGVIRLARKIVPDLPLHASTQMTVEMQSVCQMLSHLVVLVTVGAAGKYWGYGP